MGTRWPIAAKRPAPFNSSKAAVRLLPDLWRAHFELGMALGHKGDQKSATPGVSQIVMLEIKLDDALRYIASAVDSRGGLHEDNHCVSRGSVVRLDDFIALIWVHGVALR